MACAVEVAEGAGHVVTGGEISWVDDGLEQAAANDLEALLRTGWTPGGIDTFDDVS